MGSDRVYFYRRSIALRAGEAQFIEYAMTPIARERADPVPVRAGFPTNWRPSRELGMCLFELWPPARVFETFVPRSQFRHYEGLKKAEALELYPQLLDQELRTVDDLAAETDAGQRGAW